MGASNIIEKLRHIDETRVRIETVVERKPDFPTRARDLLRRTVKVDALIDELIDGLRMAGLVIED